MLLAVLLSLVCDPAAATGAADGVARVTRELETGATEELRLHCGKKGDCEAERSSNDQVVRRNTVPRIQAERIFSTFLTASPVPLEAEAGPIKWRVERGGRREQGQSKGDRAERRAFLLEADLWDALAGMGR